MATISAGGVLTISIDLETSAGSASQRRPIESTLKSLLKGLELKGIAATFPLVSPAESAYTSTILKGSPVHEVALIADRSWLAGNSRRATLAANLVRHGSQSRAAGYSLSTLALAGIQLTDHWDLFIKHGFTAIRTTRKTSSGLLSWRSHLARFAASHIGNDPSAIRFGLWDLQTTMHFPSGGDLRRAWSGIDHAAASGAAFHLRVDVPALAAGGSRDLERFERVTEYARRRERAGALRIRTLRSLAAQLSQGRQTRPAQSVLRPRAA